jgi:hypothetical protein
MNVLPKSGVVGTSVEEITYFKSENAKVSSSFDTNYCFFERSEWDYNACIILNKFLIISCKT